MKMYFLSIYVMYIERTIDIYRYSYRDIKVFLYVNVSVVWKSVYPSIGMLLVGLLGGALPAHSLEMQKKRNAALQVDEANKGRQIYSL